MRHVPLFTQKQAKKGANPTLGLCNTINRDDILQTEDTYVGHTLHVKTRTRVYYKLKIKIIIIKIRYRAMARVAIPNVAIPNVARSLLQINRFK